MSESLTRLQIAIDINVMPGLDGGIARSTEGLVQSLGQLDGPERYVLVVDRAGQRDWIAGCCGQNQRIVMLPVRRGMRYRGRRRSGNLVKRSLQTGAQVVRQLTGRMLPQSAWPEVPISDGFYETLGCNVLHFPTQWFVLCSLPTIYNPHDLQHLHYPQFWPPEELARREAIYPAACRFAHTVAVGSEWIKKDVVGQYAVRPEKVQVIPWASPATFFPIIGTEEVDEVQRRLRLPLTYALYPAVTWPHKNHMRLLEALAAIRDQHGIVLNLVCTGAKYEPHWPLIDRRVRELRLDRQVSFLGFLDEVELRAVYQLAQFLVLPSLFEADSCPIYEAWLEGVPVASSNHCALPEQVGDAALLFDAADTACIGEALRVMSADEVLRRRLVERGRRRLAAFSWGRTAKAYRAVYRRAAGVGLTDEDRYLLNWNWMAEPLAGTRDGTDNVSGEV